MRIISQTNTMDINYDDVYLYVIGQCIDAKSLSRSSSDFSMTIAIYNTEEEAKEALDLCLEAYVRNKKVFRFPPKNSI